MFLVQEFDVFKTKQRKQYEQTHITVFIITLFYEKVKGSRGERSGSGGLRSAVHGCT